MNKEELVKLKKKLESEKRRQSKYLIENLCGYDDGNKYTLEDIHNSCDEKTAVNDIESLFESLIYHYNYQNIKYDFITLYLVYGLFYKECDFTETGEILESAQSAYDYAKIEISFYNCGNGDKNYDEDPTEMLSGKSFIVSLSEFSKQLYLHGFDISTMPSFYEIDKSIKEGNGLVSQFKIHFSNINKKALK